MKRKRYTEEQIVRILKEAENQGNATDIIRRKNIAQSTFFTNGNKSFQAWQFHMSAK